MVGRHAPGLYDCLHALERAHRISAYKKELFLQLLRARNKAIHHPATITEKDFDLVIQSLRLLEAKF